MNFCDDQIKKETPRIGGLLFVMRYGVVVSEPVSVAGSSVAPASPPLESPGEVDGSPDVPPVEGSPPVVGAVGGSHGSPVSVVQVVVCVPFGVVVTVYVQVLPVSGS